MTAHRLTSNSVEVLDPGRPKHLVTSAFVEALTAGARHRVAGLFVEILQPTDDTPTGSALRRRRPLIVSM